MGKWKADLFEQGKIMDDTFWIMYFLCEGCGINKMDQGLYAAQFKELCCRGYTNIEPPVVDGVLCGSVAKELCIYSECQMPPSKPNPTIALCTWRLNKETASGPAQVEMKLAPARLYSSPRAKATRADSQRWLAVPV